MRSLQCNEDSVCSCLQITSASCAPLQGLTDLLMEAIGPYAAPYQPEAFRDEGWNEEPVGPDYGPALAPLYFNWRKASIYGGSNEIQKNILAKMVLGL